VSKHEPPPLFTLHRDGGREYVTVDYWPDEMRITAQVLDVARPEYLTRDADEVTFHCANGEATYRIIACDRNEVYHTVAVRRMWKGLP
jgi:hypothetical protein